MKTKPLFTTLLFSTFLLCIFNTLSVGQNGIESKKPGSDKVMNVTSIKVVDVNTLMHWVMRKSYRESVDDLTHLVAKVKSSNQKKNRIRDELKKVRQFVSGSMAMQDYLLELELFRLELIMASAEKIERISNPKQKVSGSEINTIVRNLIKNRAYTYSGLATNVRTDIPNRIPIGQVTSLESLNSYLADLEQKLNNMGDEEPFENSDLQNILQKQQELLRAMANVSKLLHDTAKSIIGKMK